MPSIASFLDVTIPRENKMEIDGVSLTGKIAAVGLNATYTADKKLNITWVPLDKNSQGKIWLATTNEFKKGGSDKYELIKEVPLSAGKTVIDVSKIHSDFHKIVLESPDGFQNRWVILK